MKEYFLTLFTIIGAMTAFPGEPPNQPEPPPPGVRVPEPDDSHLGRELTPAEEAGRNKILEEAARAQERAKNWKPTKALDDIVGKDQPLPVKKHIVRELIELQRLILMSKADDSIQEQLKKGTLQQIQQIVPGVPPERLAKLVKVKPETLFTIKP